MDVHLVDVLSNDAPTSNHTHTHTNAYSVACAGAREAAGREQLAFAEAGFFHEPNVEVVEAAGDLLAFLLGLLRIPKQNAALRAVGEPHATNVHKNN